MSDASETRPNIGQVRVLIVDDNPSFRRELRIFLEASGNIKVVGEAENGMRGVELAEHRNPDIVLMDQNMPTLSGVEATRRIKASRPRIRVIFIAAEGRWEHDAIRAGAERFFLKDDDLNELVKAIQDPLSSLRPLVEPEPRRVFGEMWENPWLWRGIGILTAILYLASLISSVKMTLVWTALAFGLFFFLYGLKYYLSVALILLATSGNANNNGHANGALNGRLNGWLNGLRNGERNGKSNGERNGRGLNGVKAFNGGNGRLPNHLQPFICIHLPLYNETEVVDRLLTACTSLDYENYEIIVADDSTDETTQILQERWESHPRVKLSHRIDRSGFKGGALQVAVHRMDPRTEFIAVFDADFVPPPDILHQFLAYFYGLNGSNGNHIREDATHISLADDKVAVVQGYQWHMLNASENWITRGIRTEYSGSYVIERTGQELFGSMKMISGSVFMIRADVLKQIGWKTSITEDWELTIRLYLAGYKVLYTPFIQAPAECVASFKQLTRQRMRWAEGHTFNVKKYFMEVLRSTKINLREKLEWVYFAPYYLQAAFFLLGTGAWLISDFILKARLPFWTRSLGWSLVFVNGFSLILMNVTGLFLERGVRRNWRGLLSFVLLTYLLVPYQAYAALKGLFEPHEGGWHRTQKTGVITEVLGRLGMRRRLRRLRPKPSEKKKGGSLAFSGRLGSYIESAIESFDPWLERIKRLFPERFRRLFPQRLKQLFPRRFRHLAGRLGLRFRVAFSLTISLILLVILASRILIVAAAPDAFYLHAANAGEQPLNSKVGTFTALAGTGSQSVSGVGFEPKAVLFWITDRTSEGSGAYARFGRGWTDGSNQAAIATAWDDEPAGGSDSNESRDRIVTSASITLVDHNGNLLAEASTSSFDADGFTLNWTTSGGSRLVTYLALGGDTLTNVKVGGFVWPFSSMNYSETGIGFQPDAVMLAGIEMATGFGTTTRGGHGFGIALSSSDRHSDAHRWRNNVTDVDSGSSGLMSNRALVFADDTNTPENELDLVSMDADGFSLTKAVGLPDEQVTVIYLALEGMNIDRGMLTQPTSTGNQSVSGLTFQPTAVLFDGGDKATVDGFEQDAEMVAGVATSSSEEASFWIGAQNTSSPYPSDTSFSASRSILSYTAGTPASNAQAEFVSMNADGFTINWTQADSTQRRVGWIALGSVTPSISPAGESINTTLGSGAATLVFDDIADEAYWYTDLTYPTGNDDASISAGNYTLNMYFDQLPGAWWDTDYLYRQQITVSTGAAGVAQDYSVSFTFNHTSLVSSLKSLSNGNDVRVLHWNGSGWTEIDRVLDPLSSWNDASTKIWFALEDSISASSSDNNYYLYYGNSSATGPPESWANVFILGDDFDDGALTNDVDISSAGTATISEIGGEAFIDLGTNETTDAGIIVTANALPSDNQFAIQHKTKVVSGGGVSNPEVKNLGIVEWPSQPGVELNTTENPRRRIIDFQRVDTLASLLRWDNVGQDYSWDGSNWVTGWGSWGNLALDTYYIHELISYGTDWYLRVSDANGSVITTTTPVSWANTLDNGDPFWFYWGDVYTNFYYADVKSDWVYVRDYVNPEPTTLLSGEENAPYVKIDVSVYHTKDDGTDPQEIITSSTITINGNTSDPYFLPIGSGVEQTFTSADPRRVRVYIDVTEVNGGGSFTLAYDSVSNPSALITPALSIPGVTVLLLAVVVFIPVVTSIVTRKRRLAVWVITVIISLLVSLTLLARQVIPVSAAPDSFYLRDTNNNGATPAGQDMNSGQGSNEITLTFDDLDDEAYWYTEMVYPTGGDDASIAAGDYTLNMYFEELPTDWWDSSYGYRKELTITAGSADIPSGYSVSLTFDHAAMVSAGRSQEFGDDIRITYWNGSDWDELERVLDPGSAWNTSTTTIWFQTQAAIPASSSDSDYDIYYGNGSAASPPEDSEYVFFFYDGFESGDLSAWGGIVEGDGDYINVDDFIVHTGDNAAEAWVDDGTEAAVENNFTGQGGLSTTVWIYLPTDYNASSAIDVVQYYTGGWTTKIATLSISTSLYPYIWTYIEDEPYYSLTPLTTGEWHSLEIKMLISDVNGKVELWQDGVKKVDEPGIDTGTATIDHNVVGLAYKPDGTGEETIYFDDCFDRLWVNPEPTTGLGSEETPPSVDIKVSVHKTQTSGSDPQSIVTSSSTRISSSTSSPYALNIGSAAEQTFTAGDPRRLRVFIEVESVNNGGSFTLAYNSSANPSSLDTPSLTIADVTLLLMLVVVFIPILTTLATRKRKMATWLVSIVLALLISIGLLGQQVVPVSAAPDAFYFRDTTVNGATPAGEDMNNSQGTSEDTLAFDTTGQNAYWYTDITYPVGGEDAILDAGTYNLNMYFDQLPSSTSWWDSNYLYRQKITVTNNDTIQLGSNTIAAFTANTQQLINDSQLRSDGNDWRIAHWNGSGWDEITQLVEAGWNTTSTETWFRLVDAIDASASDSNYYVYYGNSGETTSPSTFTTSEQQLESYINSDGQSAEAIDYNQTEWGAAQGVQFNAGTSRYWKITRFSFYQNANSAGTDEVAGFIFDATDSLEGDEITNGKSDAVASNTFTNYTQNDLTWSSAKPKVKSGTQYYIAILPTTPAGRNASTDWFRWDFDSSSPTYRSSCSDCKAYGVAQDGTWDFFFVPDGSDRNFYVYGREAANDDLSTVLGSEQTEGVEIRVTVSHAASGGGGATTIVQSSVTSIKNSTSNPYQLNVGSGAQQTFTSSDPQRLRVQIEVVDANDQSFTLAYDSTSNPTNLETPSLVVLDVTILLVAVVILIPIATGLATRKRRMALRIISVVVSIILALTLLAQQVIFVSAAPDIFYLHDSDTGSSPAWYDTSWSYRKKLTIDNTKVPADQTNFPVLVSLASDADLAAKAQNAPTAGYDILFTSSNGTSKLSHEIEYFDDTTGELVAWVELSNIYSSSDTEFYMYYGNASAGDQQDAPGTWSNNFDAVYHLHDNFADSSGNHAVATNNGSSDISDGLAADGQSFNGSSHYIDTNFSSNYASSTSFTWSGWFRPNGVNGSDDVMGIEDRGAGDDSEIRLAIRDDVAPSGEADSYDVWIRPDGGGSYSATIAVTDPEDGNWHYAVLQRDGSTARLYYDGGEVDNDVVSTGALNFPVTLLIGAQWYTDSSGQRNYFEGDLDEIRISTEARTANWIQTEYNNLSSPSTFYKPPGSEEPAPISPSGKYMDINEGSGSATKIFDSTDDDSYWYTDLTYPTGGDEASIAAGDYTLNMYFDQLPSDWWDTDYLYRQQITITTTSSGVDAGYSVDITFDHETLVTDTKSLISGDDVRVVHWTGSGWTELDRALDPLSSWDDTSTQVWFALEDPISASSADNNYYLYYGNSSASSPPDDWANVFMVGDDFDDGALTSDLSTSTAGTASITEASGEAFIDLGTTETTDAGIILKTTELPIDNQFAIVHKTKVVSGGGVSNPEVKLIGIGEDSSQYAVALNTVENPRRRIIDFQRIDTDAQVYYYSDPVTPNYWDGDAWQTGNGFWGNLSLDTYYIHELISDGTDWYVRISDATGAEIEVTAPILWSNTYDNGESFWFYWGEVYTNFYYADQKSDWVYVRDYVDPEPTTGLGGEVDAPFVDVIVSVYHTNTSGGDPQEIVTSSSVRIDANTSDPLALSIGSGSEQTFTSSDPRHVRVLIDATAVNGGGSFTLAYDSATDPSSLDTPSMVVPDITLFLAVVVIFIPMIVNLFMRKRRLATRLASYGLSIVAALVILATQTYPVSAEVSETTNTFWLYDDTTPEQYMMYQTQPSGSELSATGTTTYFYSDTFPADWQINGGTSTVYVMGEVVILGSSFTITLDAGSPGDWTQLGTNTQIQIQCPKQLLTLTMSTSGYTFSSGERLRLTVTTASGATIYWDGVSNNSRLVTPTIVMVEWGLVFLLLACLIPLVTGLLTRKRRLAGRIISVTVSMIIALSILAYQVGIVSAAPDTLYLRDTTTNGATPAGQDMNIDQGSTEDTLLFDDAADEAYWYTELTYPTGGDDASIAAGDYTLNMYFDQLPATWYDSGWSYRKLLTLDSSMVATDFTAFPVLVGMTDADLIGNTQGDGGDILFTTDDGTTKLDHEIESFNSGTGELVAWVEVTNLSGSSDTDIYMYYGNSGAADQWNISGTWDSDYIAVWHLDENGDGTLNEFNDSTANDNHGTGGKGYSDYAPTQGTGQIGYGQTFDGNDLIDMASSGWLDSNWPYRKRILIQGSEVSGTSDFSNFPVLIDFDPDSDNDLKFTGNGGHVGKDDGTDIFFTNDEGTKLDHEIETYDPTTGELIAWVEVSELYHSADTTIYMYYGYASAPDQQNVSGTWDEGGSGDYKGVWHLNEDPTDPAPQFLDSTSNPNEGTAMPVGLEPSQTTGQIVNALAFDDTNERHVEVSHDTSMQLGTNITVSAWVKTTDTETDVGIIANKWGSDPADRNYWLGKLNETTLSFYVDDTQTITTDLSSINNGEWHYVVGVADVDNSLLRIYVDGTQRNSGAYDGDSVLGTSDFYIGSGSGATQQEFDGSIDEVRVSGTARPLDWIATEFANQDSPSTFYQVLSEEQQSDITLDLTGYGLTIEAWVQFNSGA
ncbi:MAG TPA: DUF2341 domain-containing protein, partial [Anaerolineae bacterium]|nr:DUF2341 domain-containing protein [Anaerolineae bacterium]